MALSIHQQRHIEAWQSSSLSQAAYCREHKLNSKTFGNWLRIYRTEQLDSQAPAAMIPVNIKPAGIIDQRIIFIRIWRPYFELPADVSPQWLGELLKCLD